MSTRNGTANGPVNRAEPGQAERLHTFSHDLRNKLSGLFEAMRLLREAPTGKESTEIAHFAEVQFFQALRAVEDLLDDFGVERGVGQMKKERLALGVQVENAIRHSRPRLEKKTQHIELSANPGSSQGQAPLLIDGDPYYLEELLMALISNASKFSPRGARIRVSVGAEGNGAVITVRDEGVGLSAEDLPNVFERYAWLSSTSTEGEAQGRGTLARAKQWVEAHGGTIIARSDGAGRGATFTVRLPLA